MFLIYKKENIHSFSALTALAVLHESKKLEVKTSSCSFHPGKRERIPSRRLFFFSEKKDSLIIFLLVDWRMKLGH
jgi:hypothetical protein